MNPIDEQQAAVEYRDKTGGTFAAYANTAQVTLRTTNGARVTFGEIIGVKDDGSTLIVEKRAEITMDWLGLKMAAKNLQEIVAAHEQMNGEIKTPLLEEMPASEVQMRVIKPN